MTAGRPNIVSLLFGKRNSGKTTYTQDLMADYKVHNPEMKQLVVDTYDHPKYRHIPSLSDPEMLSRWQKPNTYRLFGSDTKAILSSIDKNMWNALLIFEDATKYLGRRLTDDTRRFIVDSKQKNLDIVFMFHGFGFEPPEIWPLIDSITILRTNSPHRRKNLIGNYDEVFEAWQEVQNSENPYPNKTVIVN